MRKVGLVLLVVLVLGILMSKYGRKEDVLLDSYALVPNVMSIEEVGDTITFQFEEAITLSQDVYTLVEVIQTDTVLDGYSIIAKSFGGDILFEVSYSELEKLNLGEYNPPEFLAKLRDLGQ